MRERKREREREGEREGERGTERQLPKGVEENQLGIILMRQAAWPHVVSGPWSPDVPDVNSRCDCSRPQTGVPDVVEVVHRALWGLPFPLSSSSPQKNSASSFLGSVSERRWEMGDEVPDCSLHSQGSFIWASYLIFPP